MRQEMWKAPDCQPYPSAYAAAYLHKSTSWLQGKAHSGGGPEFDNKHRPRMYTIGELKRWQLSHPLKRSTSDPGRKRTDSGDAR